MARIISIVAEVKELSHEGVEALCLRVLGDSAATDSSSQTIVLDLNQAEDASTAAFARLVLLRRDLLKEGRDLRLRGLRQRLANVWRLNRLSAVLPVQ